MTIKHLVLPGGGPNVLYVYGAIKKLAEKDIWKYDDIETIHGTSAGAIAGLIVTLNINWNDLDNYFINRPWQSVFSFTPQHFLDAYKNKGLLNIENLKLLCLPLFNAADYSIDITFKELYERCNKKLYVYVTELNNFQLEHFSVDNFPDMKVIDAIYMSSAIPPMFQPLVQDNKCYFDGGLFANYPVEQCLKLVDGVKIDEILGVKFIYNMDKSCHIQESSNISEYLFFIIRRLICNMEKQQNKEINIKNEVLIKTNGLDMDFWNSALYSSAIREKIIKDGAGFADIFLGYNLKEEN